MASLRQYLITISALLPAIIAQPTLLQRQSTPVVPLDEVSNALPGPSGSLVRVALGVGTQNYSCTTGTAVLEGALARFFDATGDLGLGVSPDTYPPRYAQAFEQSCVGSDTISCADTINSAMSSSLVDLGQHYFTANPEGGDAVPTFFLDGYGTFYAAEPEDEDRASAPSGAYAGSNGEGAVAWLFLADDGTGRSSGFTSAYRVETAGGSPGSCSGDEDMEIPYSALYYFYN